MGVSGVPTLYRQSRAVGPCRAAESGREAAKFLHNASAQTAAGSAQAGGAMNEVDHFVSVNAAEGTKFAPTVRFDNGEPAPMPLRPKLMRALTETGQAFHDCPDISRRHRYRSRRTKFLHGGGRP